MGDNKNFIIAIALSVAIIFGWQSFYAQPMLQKQRQQAAQQQATSQQQQPATPQPGAQQPASQPGIVTPAPQPAPATQASGAGRSRVTPSSPRPRASPSTRPASTARFTSRAPCSTICACGNTTRRSIPRARRLCSCHPPARPRAISPNRAMPRPPARRSSCRDRIPCGRRPPMPCSRSTPPSPSPGTMAKG